MTRTSSTRPRTNETLQVKKSKWDDPLSKDPRAAPQDFTWVANDEPHRSRRREILAKYPEVRNLFGTEWRTFPLTLMVVAIVLALGWFIPSLAYNQHPVAMAIVDFCLSPLRFVVDALAASGTFDSYVAPWRPFLFWFGCAYWLAGTGQHCLFLAIHEITHCLCFRSVISNFWLAYVANFPILIPYCVAFRGYHAEHHTYQGYDGVDVDIPTALEGKLLSNPFGKFFFVFFQLLFYALRPMIVRPQKFTRLHAQCFAAVLTFDVLFVYARYAALPAALSSVPSENAVFVGICNLLGVFPSARVSMTLATVMFLLMGCLCAGMFHPMSGHFLSEHFEFTPGQETYSYYGPLNFFGWNVGYHNEHHDFPNIPWSRLPKLRALAPEYYDTLTIHRSWIRVSWDFLLGPHNCFSRVKRRATLPANRPENPAAPSRCA